jgi:branched-chain amino acid transport system permease protein
LGWGFEATLPMAVGVPVLLACAIATPVMRLESHYFALATLGVGQVIWLIAIRWESLTGGANGLPGVPPLVIFGLAAGEGTRLVVAVWLAVAIGGAIAWRMMRGLYGHANAAARADDIAAQAAGIDPAGLRFVGFLLSAAFGGAAGALHVHTARVVSPEVLEFHVMVAALTMAVVGGRTGVAGAILGAFLLVHLPEWFRFLDKYYLIAYGAVLLAMIVVAPWGLVGGIARLRARAFPEAPPPPPRAVPLAARGRPARGGPILEVRDLALRFGGVRALDGVSLALERGEIFGLIGPNGSGKTTLVNCVTRIYTPQSGAIVFAGEDVTRLAPYEVARRGIARTFQSVNLVDDLSALDNVAVARAGLERSGVRRALGDDGLGRARGYAIGLLERLDVAQVAMQPCGGLAYGLKRRVEIARALALEPQLLLLDEPAAGLNGAEQADLAARLRALAAGGLTLLVIEHNMPFLMPLAQRMACLDYGRLIAGGTPAEIRAHPRVIEAYLGAGVEAP